MSGHPFKDIGHQIDNNMIKVTFHFCYADSDDRRDDVLHVYGTGVQDVYRVVMHMGDFDDRSYEGMMSRDRLMEHIENILQSLRYDSDPFHHVQVIPVLAPSVMYHVADLDKIRVRDLIMDTTSLALRQEVEKNEL